MNITQLLDRVKDSKLLIIAMVMQLGLSVILLTSFWRQQTAAAVSTIDTNTNQVEDQIVGGWAIYWCMQYEAKVAKQPFSIDLLVKCGTAVGKDIPGVTLKLLLPDVGG